MHYRKALQIIVETYKRVWGSFFEDLPDFNKLSQAEIQSFLIERNSKMLGIVHRNELAMSEVMRFFQEMDVICLLFVICVWGAASEEVPISLADLYEISQTFMSLCAAGVEDEKDQDAFKVALRLVEEGLRLRQLPDSVIFMLQDKMKPSPHP